MEKSEKARAVYGIIKYDLEQRIVRTYKIYFGARTEHAYNVLVCEILIIHLECIKIT